MEVFDFYDYGLYTPDDDLWQKSGNDPVLFALHKTLNDLEDKFAALPLDHPDRDYAARCIAGLQIGISLHSPISSIPERELNYNGSRAQWLKQTKPAEAQAV